VSPTPGAPPAPAGDAPAAGALGGSAARCADLSYRFGDHVAVDHVDLEIGPGETFRLLGPNGARMQGGEVAQLPEAGRLQAEEPCCGAVFFAGHPDGEHDREQGPGALEVAAPGRQQAQRPARPHQRRHGRGAFPAAGGVGDAGRAGDGSVAPRAPPCPRRQSPQGDLA
jgi:hypothetical protein